MHELKTPDEVLADLLHAADSVVVDVGCGHGFFALPGARMLTGGTLIGIDALQGNLDVLQRRALAQGIGNLQTIRVQGMGLPLPDASVDAVLVERVFRDIPNWSSLRREARRILRPGGQLCLLEWDDTVATQGPSLDIWLAPEALAQFVESGGFRTIDIRRDPKPFVRVLATRVA